ncbi:hypothetical protein E6R61_03665 [Streptomyces sp. LRa12]|nr:hypothetical protein E6R61_03665 [Streptomyces sp. LRa12]
MAAEDLDHPSVVFCSLGNEIPGGVVRGTRRRRYELRRVPLRPGPGPLP